MRRLLARHAHSLLQVLASFTVLLLACGLARGVPPSERESKVRGDIAKFENDTAWVYNDWDKAVADAKQSGKPLMVALRCVPCEACSEFDDQLIRRVDEVRDLMDRFICVRIITTNGLDLDQFQFDYDQSFHAFLMNADGTIYGRFGTRSESKDETQDMTMQGFRRAMEGALHLHADYPANKALFVAKRGPKPPVAHPEEYPTLKDKYTSELDVAGNVVKSCIHCHQIREAERRFYRDVGKRTPENVLFPYPLPKVIGLKLNAQECAEVKEVVADSPAAEAGLQPGDRIEALAEQPLLSIADLQWVLHRAPSSGSLPVQVRRGKETVMLTLKLDEGWRKKSDLSWRPTSWDLRRISTGGIFFEDLPAEDRSALNLPPDVLALRAKYVAEHGEHAAAKKAGFVKGDVLVEYDGSRSPLRETDVLARGFADRKPGDKIPVIILRDGKERPMSLPIQ